MISHPPTFVLIGLGVALVAMFGFGFYWLATKDRPTRPLSPVTPSPARGGAGRASPMSTNPTNGKRSRRIPIMSSRQRTKPPSSRTTAIPRLVDTKNPSTHPLRAKLAMTCTAQSNR